jgi:hypothetical protein
LLVPVWIYFETFRVAGYLGSAPARFELLDHVGTVLAYLLRYELLAPAAGAKLASLVALRFTGGAGPSEGVGRVIETSRVLWLVLCAYVGCTFLLPFSYERYVTVLVPMLALLLSLDGWTVFALARAAGRAPAFGWAKRGVVVMWVICAAWLLPLRTAELPSRLEEWRTPYRGPIDYAIEYIRGAYAHPEDLVIATNYEGPTLMYYLGSKVTIGYAWSNLREDLATPPDIIIVRRWGNLMPLLELAKGGKFETKTFEVLDLPINNVPQVSPTRFVPMTHQYRTPLAETPDQAFKILVRSPGPR